MKTFSKILSMILVVVMCFGLFATSASAGTITVNGGTDSGMAGGGDIPVGNITVTTPNAPTVSDDWIDPTEPTVPVEPSNPSGITVSSNDDDDGDTDADTDTDADSGDSGDSGDILVKSVPVLRGGGLVKGSPGTPTNLSFDQTKTGNTDLEDTISGGTFIGFAYTLTSNYTTGTELTSTQATFDGSTLTIKKSWLMSLEPTVLYIWGIQAGSGKAPELLTIVTITADYGNFTVSPKTFVKYEDPPKKITVTSDGKKLNAFDGFFLVASVSSSGTSITNYTVSTDGSTLTIDSSEFANLTKGDYFIYGYVGDNYEKQVKLGKVTVTAKDDGGYNSSDPGKPWTLTPTSYPDAWISGDDPLLFKSDLMAKRGKPGYNIIVRFGDANSTIPDNLVGVNQYWDMGDGVFALGLNFLSSLPSGSYKIQVIDLLHLNDCTNYAYFRIGPALRAIDTDKHVITSIKNLRFLCDDPVSQVLVHGIPLTLGEDYALSYDRKTITLSFEFLNKRTPGNTYTITAVTKYGDRPSTTFQILSTAQGSASPKTGDESNLGLWAAFLLLSGTAVVVLVPKLRKHGM